MKNETHEHRSGAYLFGADWRTQERYTKDCQVCMTAMQDARLAARKLAAELNMQDYIEWRKFEAENGALAIRDEIQALDCLSRSLMYAVAAYNQINGTDFVRVGDLFAA